MEKILSKPSRVRKNYRNLLRVVTSTHNLIIKTSPNGVVFAFQALTKTSSADLSAESEDSPFPGAPLPRK